MHRMQQMQTDKKTKPTGFTLIELLVVISIIALLSALLLGGIQAARLSVANAKAGNELNSMSTGLAQFHSEFGMYPPSSIVLYENSAGWAGDIRSQALIRKLWPNFNFGLDRKLTDNANTTDTIILDGRECLVFFLGGMMDKAVIDGVSVEAGFPMDVNHIGEKPLIGFSKNPSDPFSTTGSNRTGPFHEFILNRMVNTDVDNEGYAAEYLDTYSGQSTPILYVSSYNGRGYRDADVIPFLSNGVYRQGAAAGAAWKSKTYQLVSPGQDTIYGTGGWYDPDKAGGISADDWDNITNFTSGKLK